MSAPDKTGGPAFPTYPTHTPGMTLRDYFAGQALVGILLGGGQMGQAAQENPSIAASWAYQQADAMLAAREEKP